MNAVAGSRDAAAFCADLVRSHDFPRYASTLFVSAEQRRALLALYAFNVEISRVRDQVSQPLPGEIRLQWWTDMLAGDDFAGQNLSDQDLSDQDLADRDDGGDQGGVQGNPVASELRLAVRDFRLPVEPLSRLIEEHQFDLYNDPMPTLAALEGYVTDTSSALLALAARIAAPPSEEAEHLARHAGLAQGFAQVLASLPRDASRRQLFLPQQLLESQGSAIEEVFAGKQTPRLRAAIDQMIGEAMRHLDAAFDLLATVPAEVRPVFLPLALVRRELARMTRADADLFGLQAMSRLSILWTLWRASRSRRFRDRD
ncbi:phytoene/squalene synthase family protein [Bradyrhizobium sp.]|uniref:phytoene/squalene synthase family protein n=1 Tax=Bradyrhizobium sp. TaxID=376 RepID=UPI003C4E3E9C